MRRSLIILFGVLAVAGAVFASAFLLSHRICVARMTNPADDLDWLRQEFHLSDAEIARVRKLHDGYLPKCKAMCKEIAAKKQELETTLAGTTSVTAGAFPVSARSVSRLARISAHPSSAR